MQYYDAGCSAGRTSSADQGRDEGQGEQERVPSSPSLKERLETEKAERSGEQEARDAERQQHEAEKRQAGARGAARYAGEREELQAQLRQQEEAKEREVTGAARRPHRTAMLAQLAAAALAAARGADAGRAGRLRRRASKTGRAAAGAGTLYRSAYAAGAAQQQRGGGQAGELLSSDPARAQLQQRVQRLQQEVEESCVARRSAQWTARWQAERTVRGCCETAA